MSDDNNKIEEVNSRLDLAMRSIKDLSTNEIRKEIVQLVNEATPKTAAFEALKKSEIRHVLKEHPGLTDQRVEGLILKQSMERVRKIVWLDRYLFDAPPEEKSEVYFLSFSKLDNGEVDRLFPLQLKGKSLVIIVHRRTIYPLDSPVSASTYREEFEYYAKHFRRRSRWW